MRRIMAAAAVALMLTAGCSSADGGNSPAAPTTPDPQAADAKLILAMYADINAAFQRKPDDGVRAIIAAQYPEDLADVDFARCVSAISPGAKTLPKSKKMHFTPNILTTALDPGYKLTSDRVKGLHPKGRIYVTDVTITDGRKPAVHQRHQVILDGKAYQFSMC
ncbi:MAG: hypothetical protein ABIP19_12245 [Dermatophilaceae bacterium]